MKIARTLTLLVVFVTFGVSSALSEERKVAPAYGDTPEFWESYSLVVAKVVKIEHREKDPTLVVSDVRLEIQDSVPERYKAGTPFSLTFTIDWATRPIRDKPGYAVDLDAGDRVMLMMTEEKGKLIHATPRIPIIPNYFDPNAAIDLKAGSDPILLVFEFRGISAFEMLPGWRIKYPKEDDALVAETVRVCQALAESNVARRLELIAAIQQTKPNDRVKGLLRRRLQVTLETSLRQAQDASRLLKTDEDK